MKIWDNIEKHCIFDHGWSIDKNDKIILTEKQFKEYHYSGYSIKDNKIRTLMIPSNYGLSLIFEHKHFIVEG